MIRIASNFELFMGIFLTDESLSKLIESLVLVIFRILKRNCANFCLIPTIFLMNLGLFFFDLVEFFASKRTFEDHFLHFFDL